MTSLYEGYTVLPGIVRITDAVLEEQIVENFIDFFNWGLLQVGGFINVKRPSFKSKFKPTSISGFADGRVWEPPTGNWIWEKNISWPYQPIHAPGVYVNGILSPLNSGYYVNYRDGQIVFDTPKPSTTVVEFEYSYRRFNFYDTNNDFFQQVVFDPIPTTDVLNILSVNRVYLPAIFIERPGGGRQWGYQLGDARRIERIPILFHILSDNDESRDKIVRVIKNLHSHTIMLYDTNRVADANKFAINADGSVNPDAYTYPDLLENFVWKRCRVVAVDEQENTPQLPLFRAILRMTVEILMP